MDWQASGRDETGRPDAAQADAARALAADAEALARLEPRFLRLLAAHGLPAPREAPRGLGGLVRAVVGQQLSIHAAARIWARLQALCDPGDPEALLALPPGALRSAGLSAPKIRHVRGLAEAVSSGRLDLSRLPAADEEAVAALVALPGIGRWTAEIYLLFAERRRDVLPAGDLALQLAAARLFGLAARPSERALRAMAEAWSPRRSAAAHLLWHAYRLPPV